MNTEQERAEFEAWAKRRGMTLHKASPCDGSPPYYLDTASIAAWEAYQAGRAALQSQDREDAERMDFISVEANVGSSLVSDDNGKWAFTDSGIAPVIANGQGFTETVGITAIVDPDMWKDSPREAIDHARRIEGEAK